MKKIILVASTLLVFAIQPAHAEWSKQYATDYIMGDGDNRASARQAALEQIKLKASGEAGTYVQSTTTLRENGEMTENVQILSAAMVKVLASEEKLSVNRAGQAVLQIKATASLDETELVRRVEMLRQDKDKERKLKQLQSENEALRKEYAEIRAALAAKLDQAKTMELLSRQDATVKRISENGQTMTQVFERGTLLQMASRNEGDFEKAKRDLDENFYAPLMQSPATAIIESVEGSGNFYTALIRVGWNVDTRRARQVLSRYLNVGNDFEKGNSRQMFAGKCIDNCSFTISTYNNLDGRGPSVLSEQVYRYITKKWVVLQLQIAGETFPLPVFFADGSFFQDCSNSTNVEAMHEKDRKNLCLVSHHASDPKILGVTTGISNPLRIPLTRSQAELATRVEVSWASNSNTPDARALGR